MLVFYLLLTITVTGVYSYLPDRLIVLHARMAYYLFGAEADKGRVAHVQRLVAGLVRANASAPREL